MDGRASRDYSESLLCCYVRTDPDSFIARFGKSTALSTGSSLSSVVSPLNTSPFFRSTADFDAAQSVVPAWKHRSDSSQPRRYAHSHGQAHRSVVNNTKRRRSNLREVGRGGVSLTIHLIPGSFSTLRAQWNKLASASFTIDSCALDEEHEIQSSPPVSTWPWTRSTSMINPTLAVAVTRTLRGLTGSSSLGAALGPVFQTPSCATVTVTVTRVARRTMSRVPTARTAAPGQTPPTQSHCLDCGRLMRPSISYRTTSPR